MHSIKIASPQGIVALPYEKLRAAARAVLEGEDVGPAKISLAFVDNATIHRLNKQFLEHDEPTDVLTFPLSGDGAKTLEGEIVIGVEVAVSQASERNHSVENELCLYVIHGLLHLCRYDDTSDGVRALMRQRERHYLAQLGLPDIAE